MLDERSKGLISPGTRFRPGSALSEWRVFRSELRPRQYDSPTTIGQRGVCGALPAEQQSQESQRPKDK
jgi:hypothetical protein